MTPPLPVPQMPVDSPSVPARSGESAFADELNVYNYGPRLHFAALFPAGRTVGHSFGRVVPSGGEWVAACSCGWQSRPVARTVVDALLQRHMWGTSAGDAAARADEEAEHAAHEKRVAAEIARAENAARPEHWTGRGYWGAARVDPDVFDPLFDGSATHGPRGDA